MDSCSETMDSCFDVAKMLAILIFVIWFFAGCEKDDICLRETPGTPRLVIELFDIDNKNNLKSTNGLKIIC